MVLSKREKRIFYFCISIAVAASLYIFAVEPLLERWEVLKIEGERKELELQKNLKAVEEKDRLYKEFETIKGRIKLKESGTIQVSAFLTALETKARSNQIQIANIEPFPAKDYGFYKKLLVRMNIKSAVGSLAKFLYEVQNAPEMVVIERLQINSGARYSSLLKVEILMSLIVLGDEERGNGLSKKQK